MSGEEAEVLRKLGLAVLRNPQESLENRAPDLGQSCPQHCPHPEDALGEAISIREAARIIGCSPWTVRQKYIPAGLPHHRLSPRGKLFFYRSLITRWLIRRQKGGTTP